MTADERLLAPWFAAARAEAADPPLALLSAILADAGEIGAARAAGPEAAPAPIAPVAAPAAVARAAVTPGAAPVPIAPEAASAAVRAAPRRSGRRWLQGVGGWKGLTALAACAAIGFWIGIAGRVTIEDGAVWAGSPTAAMDATDADTGLEDPVVAFFDLASVEG